MSFIEVSMLEEFYEGVQRKAYIRKSEITSASQHFCNAVSKPATYKTVKIDTFLWFKKSIEVELTPIEYTEIPYINLTFKDGNRWYVAGTLESLKIKESISE